MAATAAPVMVRAFTAAVMGTVITEAAGSGTAGAYQEVQPPAGLAEQMDVQAPAVKELFVFPNGDQSNEQLERDHEACRDWAAQQAGFDPDAAAPSTKASDRSAKRASYLRAEGACLVARDYSVE